MSGGAPTGCYKCGRPGHWSRDCSITTSPNPNPSHHPSKLYTNEKKIDKSTKKKASRPKLTPEMLVSDNGLGYVLRHFPSHFKFRGNGHEVSDLGNLIGLYSQWHSHLLPLFPFYQFVQKVEQVGATKRLKMCVRELKERVAIGGDPTRLREMPAEVGYPNDEQGLECTGEASNSKDPSHVQEDPFQEDHADANVPEDIFNEIYQDATEGASQPLDSNISAPAPAIE